MKQKLIKVVAKEINTYRAEHHADEGSLLNLQKACLATLPDSPNTQPVLQKILTWYQNNVKEEANMRPRGRKSYTKKYNGKEVAKELFKDQITEHIATLTDAPSGSPGWLKYYPGAHTAVYEKLDEDDKKECEETADAWNKEGPDVKKQAKWAFDLLLILMLYKCFTWQKRTQISHRHSQQVCG